MNESDDLKASGPRPADRCAGAPASSSERIAIVTLRNAAQVGQRVPVELIEHCLLKQAHAVWLAKRGGRPFPAREDITPRDMAAFLSNVTLFQIVNGGLDFKYRIMGDNAVIAYGRSFRGMGRSELNTLRAGMGDVVARICSWLFRKQEPLVMRGMLRKDVIDARHQETIFLPLGDVIGVVDHVLSVGTYVPQSLRDLKVFTDDPDDGDDCKL